MFMNIDIKFYFFIDTLDEIIKKILKILKNYLLFINQIQLMT